MTKDVPGGQSVTGQSFMGGSTSYPGLAKGGKNRAKVGKGIPVLFPLSLPTDSASVACDVCGKAVRPDKLWALRDRRARLSCKACKNRHLIELAELEAAPPPAVPRLGIGRHRVRGNQGNAKPSKSVL